MDKLRLFFFFEFSDRNIGFLLNDMLNGFLANDRSILVSHLVFLHFLVLGNLIAEIGSLFKVFLSSSLSLEILSFN